MENLILSPAPHIHTKDSSRRIMLDVIIALLPAAVASVVIFGVKALPVLAACVIGAVVSEFLFNLVTGRKQTVGDLSAVVTGLLLALNLSTNVPVWQCVIGAAFAVVIVKCLFGGLGHNFANPAITARVFMLIAFSAVAGGAQPAGVELVSSATPLEVLGNGGSDLPSLWEMFIGLRGGAIGETCVAALLLGYVYLVCRKVIKWYVPAAFVGSVFVLYLIFTGDITMAAYEMMAGGLFIGAIFMATDYVTSPFTLKGKLVYGVALGIVTFAIREWGSYAEGVSFALLFMNLWVPYINDLTRQTPYGYIKPAKPAKEAAGK